jgi:hypothetical protein
MEEEIPPIVYEASQYVLKQNEFVYLFTILHYFELIIVLDQ